MRGDLPLDLVGAASDGLFDLLGGGLGVVGGELVGDLCELCQLKACEVEDV